MSIFYEKKIYVFFFLIKTRFNPSKLKNLKTPFKLGGGGGEESLQTKWAKIIS